MFVYIINVYEHCMIEYYIYIVVPVMVLRSTDEFIDISRAVA